MHIALYCDCDSRGGVLTYTLTLADALRNAGADVTIISHEPQTTFSESILNDMAACSTRLQTAPKVSNTSRDADLLADIILQSKADIYIPNYRVLPYAAAAICTRRSQIRIIGICHNDHSSYYNLLRRYDACMSRLVCASDKTAAELSAQLPERALDIAMIPHGVRVTKHPCHPFKGGDLSLIYHGRLIQEQKQVSMLLEAARRLSAKHVPYHLTLIGDGPERSTCESATREPLLQGRVTTHDSTNWPTLTNYLVNSHVAVLTSNYEGFCFSLAEAMGTGLPAVAFQCGKVIEQFVIHGKTGLLAAPGDIDGFVAMITRLQSDTGLWSELSTNARSLISSEFSWQITVRKYLALFEQALADSTPRRWTLGRPAWMSTQGRDLSSMIENVGKKFSLW